MKLKHWDVSVLGNKPAQQKENVDFYTSDTDAHLKVKLTDTGLSPTSATFTLFNKSDSSFVSESAIVTKGIVQYHMRPEIINHAGQWQLQVIFHTNKSYVARTLHFTVVGSLQDKKLPKLEIIESWSVLKAQVETFMNQSQSEITALEERVNQIITTPADTVSVQEIIDARDGDVSLGNNIRRIENNQMVHNLDTNKSYEVLFQVKNGLPRLRVEEI